MRSLRFKPEPQAELVAGKAVKGALAGLEGLSVRISEDAVRVNLAKVVVIRCDAPKETEAVACTVIAHRDGKEVGRGGDSITIGDLDNMKPSPASGFFVGPILSPTFAGERAVRPLPSAIGDLAVGGDGRFLVLFLPKIHKLALFDIGAARVVKYIPVEEDDVKFAAGRDKLVLFLPKSNVLQRWSLETFERERSMQMPIREQATTLAMGSSSQGPLLVGTLSRVAFLDLQTFKILDIQMPDNRPMAMVEGTRVRASGDGKVFGVWRSQSRPQGLETLVLIGHHLHAHYEHLSAGHVQPGPDGKVIFTRPIRSATPVHSPA